MILKVQHVHPAYSAEGLLSVLEKYQKEPVRIQQQTSFDSTTTNLLSTQTLAKNTNKPLFLRSLNRC
jgi:hypothetical protein